MTANRGLYRAVYLFRAVAATAASQPATIEWLGPACGMWPAGRMLLRPVTSEEPMGNFYCNFATHGPEAGDVVRVLNDHRRSAFVAPTVNGKTVIFEKASDELAEADIDAVGELLSRELACPALAVVVADDDEMWIGLYERGRRSVEYCSRGANRGALAISRAFGRAWLSPVVWLVLQSPIMIFETLRHMLIAKLLGIPTWCVASGHGYIQRGELPAGLRKDDLRHTG